LREGEERVGEEYWKGMLDLVGVVGLEEEEAARERFE
jgi:hypothetical protein